VVKPFRTGRREKRISRATCRDVAKRAAARGRKTEAGKGGEKGKALRLFPFFQARPRRKRRGSKTLLLAELLFLL